MGVDLTTFVLEIVNFLVLLWLLSHFLYRPVQAAIARRQQQEQDANRELSARRESLDARQLELDTARARIDDEREAARQRLGEEIAAERAKRLQALDAEVQGERAKAQARAAAERDRAVRQQEALAAQRAGEFVGRYLQRLAGAELEGALVNLFLSDLAALDDAAKEPLRAALAGRPVEVATAFAPTDASRRQVERALDDALGQPCAATWRTDPGLLAGISVRLDGHVLETSLARGLAAFGAGAETAE